jgi:hypothetical protein
MSDLSLASWDAFNIDAQRNVNLVRLVEQVRVRALAGRVGIAG